MAFLDETGLAHLWAKIKAKFVLSSSLVPSNAVESSTTASRAYAVGDYLVVNGQLRKCTAAINSGG